MHLQHGAWPSLTSCPAFLLLRHAWQVEVTLGARVDKAGCLLQGGLTCKLAFRINSGSCECPLAWSHVAPPAAHALRSAVCGGSFSMQ
jgi:hypothetical protein